MPSFRLTLSYDGTCFFGSQVQPGRRTVQGELERVLGSLAGGTVRATFAGRTDRGVHAVGQVVAVPLPAWRGSAEDLGRAVNAYLPKDLAALDVAACHEAFNPRLDAAWREYRYWIAPGEISPFVRRFAWAPRSPVDAAAVSEGARRLVGTHDFASFAGGGEGVPWSDRARRPRGTVRTILCSECREIAPAPGPNAGSEAPVLEIRVAADGFLPHMVRAIVGALVEIGQGRQPPEWIGAVLDAKDRRRGSVVAPPQGLTFWRVGFGDETLEQWRQSSPSRA